MKTLDQISALKPAILIPGHEGPGAKHDLSAIAFMKKYIADWDANVACVERRGGDAGARGQAVSGPGDGVHAQRSGRRVLPRRE